MKFSISSFGNNPIEYDTKRLAHGHASEIRSRIEDGSYRMPYVMMQYRYNDEARTAMLKFDRSENKFFVARDFNDIVHFAEQNRERTVGNVSARSFPDCPADRGVGLGWENSILRFFGVEFGYNRVVSALNGVIREEPRQIKAYGSDHAHAELEQADDELNSGKINEQQYRQRCDDIAARHHRNMSRAASVVS